MEFRGEEVTGDRGDVRRLVQKCLNQSAAKRLISKQEAVVMLGDLPLVTCSETIDTVSISNSKILRASGETSDNKTFVEKYKRRHEELLHMSLYDFYHHVKNNPHELEKRGGKHMIPNFVGINGTAKYPVTDDYARSTLVVYRAWSTYPSDLDWKEEFESFIRGRSCPPSCRMAYERVMRRYIDKMTHYDPKAQYVDHSRNPLAEDDRDLLLLSGLGTEPVEQDSDTALLKSLPRGHNYNWGREPSVSDRNEPFAVTNELGFFGPTPK